MFAALCLLGFVILAGIARAEPWVARVAHDAPTVRLLVQPRASAGGRAGLELEQWLERQGARILARFPSLGGLCVVGRPIHVSTPSFLRHCLEHPGVAHAEPDYPVQLAGRLPDDPHLLDGTLWGLNNAGQDGGVPNADIDAPEAWSALWDAGDIVVAIIDSGIRVSHQDLAPNLWLNPSDGGHGLNLVQGSGDLTDEIGHGTRLAGIIGAAGNNGLGGVGVAWNVQLMICKFVDASGEASVSSAIAGLEYARTNGAHIINASWGLREASLSLSNAIAAAGASGCVLVAAAGNESLDIDSVPFYPASFELDNIVAVAATTRRDELYPLSNYGARSVDLAAPGDEIYSTDSAADDAYATDQGSSMAAAYVSGSLALLRAQHPSESPAQLIARLRDSADSLPALQGLCVSGGRLNLRKALGVPVTAPSLSATGRAEAAVLEIGLLGDPGRVYLIEATRVWLDWLPVYTNTTDFEGRLAFTNFWQEAAGHEYFRARLLP